MALDTTDGEPYYYKVEDHSQVTWDVEDTNPPIHAREGFVHQPSPPPDVDGVPYRKLGITSLDLRSLPDEANEQPAQAPSPEQQAHEGSLSYRAQYLNCYSTTPENRKEFKVPNTLAP